MRAHAAGDLEILPWLENGWLNVAGPTSFTGTLSFSLKGQQQMSCALTVPSHTRAAALPSSPYPYRISSSGFAELSQNTDYLQQTRLVPRYISGVDPSCLSRQIGLYTPQAQLNYPNGMGMAGYHPSIGLLPEWDVTYLASKADPHARDAVMANALAAGRFALHYRDPATLKPIAFSSYPNLCLGGGPGLGVSSAGSSSKNQYTPDVSGAAPPNWANSHHPSVGFLAYLISGWTYFSEQVQFAATLNFLKQTDVVRGGSQGLLLPNAGANTTRGAAWALRTLAQAAQVAPETSGSLRSEFLASVSSNIDYYHATYIAQPNNPQGVCCPYSDYVPNDGKYEHAMWMEDFLTAAFGYLKAQALPLDNTRLSKLDQFYTWKAASIINRLGVAGDAKSFHFCDAAQYNVSVAPSDTADFIGGTGPWYSDWGQVYEATLGHPNTAAAGDQLRGAYFPDATSYWGNLQPAIVFAVNHNIPGATTSYQRMTGTGNWSQFLQSANQNPVWALLPWNA